MNKNKILPAKCECLLLLNEIDRKRLNFIRCSGWINIVWVNSINFKWKQKFSEKVDFFIRKEILSIEKSVVKTMEYNYIQQLDKDVLTPVHYWNDYDDLVAAKK